ncbi:daf-6 [Cordylochernes scorpioides]|uniref:Daf-6 n=1 Tax=Cordylochernes scorpioides TaxID=51811 RepID=A0ABY6JWC1_9ARAC|nr:daf-6 [Cordylochernes scorpioides]
MKVSLGVGKVLISALFSRLASLTLRHPWALIVIPLLLTAVLAPGLRHMTIRDDIQEIYTPHGGRSRIEKELVSRHFPLNLSLNFDQSRALDFGMFGRAILTSRDGGSVLRSSEFQEIVELDRLIRNISFIQDGQTWRYQDVCVRNHGECFRNEVLDLQKRVSSFESKRSKFSYPIQFNNMTYDFIFYGTSLGGVMTDEDGKADSAESLALIYHLDSSSSFKSKLALRWEEKFLELLENIHFEHTNVYRFSSLSLSKELENSTLLALSYFTVAVTIMFIFSVVTCLMADCVRSKPWLGICGNVSSLLAVSASLGLCLVCGVKFVSINLAIPFIMLGIGMDDAFVMLAAWRRTDPGLSLEARLRETYCHAGVSITITSLTNLTSFLVGMATPFSATNIFCTYTAVAVVFTYLYQITFFGGCFVLLARAEVANRNALTFRPSLPKSLSRGRNPRQPNHPEDNAEHFGMVFLRDKMGSFLSRPSVKAGGILIFVLYLSGGFYGCTRVKEGLEIHNLFTYHSYASEFSNIEYKYFVKYFYRIQVVVDQPLDYHRPEVQRNIDNLFLKIYSSPWIADSSLSENWLHYFRVFLNDKRAFFMCRQYNLTVKQDFLDCLRLKFLTFPPAKRFSRDIVFNENFTDIVASRFFVQSYDTIDSVRAKEMMTKLKRITDEAPFKTIAYNFFFVFLDTLDVVWDVTIQAVCISAVIMMLITFFFIPNFVCSLWVAFSIVSIEIGVLGYLTLWEVNLNPTLMVGLIMCIGFSVDNSAHIAYAFVSAKGKDSDERMRNALHYVGMPILQACISSVVGILVLADPPSYTYLVLFKTVLMIMSLSGIHGVFFLPILLSTFDKLLSRKDPLFSNKDSNKPAETVKMLSAEKENITTVPSA